MDINNFFGIAIVGVLASVIIEAVTRLAATRPLASKLVAIAVSVALGTGYYFAQQTAWWPTVITILGIASAVYALFFKKSE